MGASGVAVTLVWIKAHANFEGNEKADALAKAGASAVVISERQLRSPKIAVINLIKEAANKMWATDWMSYKHARQTKQFFSAPSAKLSKII